jgi:hypothetical protein
MGRTKKAGSKQGKTKKNNIKKEDLEDLYSDSETSSETGSETSSETSSDTSLDTDEISFDDIKDYDMTMPMFGIGLSLIALLGFAMYKGSAV